METSIIKSSYMSDLTSCHASSLDYCVCVKEKDIIFPQKENRCTSSLDVQ